MKKTIKTSLIVSALALLGGCVAVPAGPGYYPGPQVYYAPAPAYYAPAPAYYAQPFVYAPTFGFGFRGGRGGGGRRYR